MDYEIEGLSNKLFTLAELDANTWVSEVKRIRGKKQRLTAASLQSLRDEHTRALAAGPYTLSRERHVEGDGKVADAVLGRFQKDKEQSKSGRRRLQWMSRKTNSPSPAQRSAEAVWTRTRA